MHACIIVDLISMPYHIRITTKSDRSHDEVKLDLTRKQLKERFLSPYKEGRPIAICGRTVPFDNIERIRITFTKQASGQLIPIVRAERFTSNSPSEFSDEWHVADRGADVTDKFIAQPPETRLSTDHKTEGAKSQDPRIVFVVHGRNLLARDAMFTFLRSIGLCPLEWTDAVRATGRASPYIREILDSGFSAAKAVIVLMTPDDEARLREPYRSADDPGYETELTPQARLNVIFEAGIAVGRFTQDKTIFVKFGALRPFSDIGGLHEVRLTNTTQSRQDLAQRLQSAGCPVNLSGTDWHSAGNFDVLPDSKKKEKLHKGLVNRARDKLLDGLEGHDE